MTVTDVLRSPSLSPVDFHLDCNSFTHIWQLLTIAFTLTSRFSQHGVKRAPNFAIYLRSPSLSPVDFHTLTLWTIWQCSVSYDRLHSHQSIFTKLEITADKGDIWLTIAFTLTSRFSQVPLPDPPIPSNLTIAFTLTSRFSHTEDPGIFHLKILTIAFTLTSRFSQSNQKNPDASNYLTIAFTLTSRFSLGARGKI